MGEEQREIKRCKRCNGILGPMDNDTESKHADFMKYYLQLRTVLMIIEEKIVLKRRVSYLDEITELVQDALHPGRHEHQ